MKENKVSVKVVPDLRRIRKDKTYTLKLRLTFKGARKYYATPLSATTADWEKINATNVKGRLRQIKNQIAEIEINAEKIIENITPFSFKKFEKNYFETHHAKATLKDLYEQYMQDLKANNQIGNALSYQKSLNSLISFKKNIDIEDITVEFLKKYERWLLEKGRSKTTVGIYLRPLRCILNVAMSKDMITNSDYPFGSKKYIIPTSNNIKKALSKNDIKRIFEYASVPH